MLLSLVLVTPIVEAVGQLPRLRFNDAQQVEGDEQQGSRVNHVVHVEPRHQGVDLMRGVTAQGADVQRVPRHGVAEEVLDLQRDQGEES